MNICPRPKSFQSSKTATGVQISGSVCIEMSYERLIEFPTGTLENRGSKTRHVAESPNQSVMAALALLTNTQLLLILLGGLYVMETVSLILQVVSFRGFGHRNFKMAPIHHHFELKGWNENQVIIRFWIISILFSMGGVALLKVI